MLIQDHHLWPDELGKKINKSREVIWNVMVEEWCRQCLTEEDKRDFITKVAELFRSRRNA